MRKTKIKKTKIEKPETITIERKILVDLASCAAFTLDNYKHLSRGSGLVINLKTKEPLGPWQDKFFNALDAVGIVYDRKKYFANVAKRR